ncbi:MAG: UDP-N-acetylglucosamine 2-epimerase (hydrolyzing), partial [Lentisphaerae bacterium]|nr:UDP-N-acetylglucosamine 2-epimerase (hydrolyzing) [Lentisphaerota bacterium]
MRTIGVVTGARSDYGIYRPLLQAILPDGALRLHLLVTGMHLSRDFGYTVRQIEEDGFPIGERVEIPLASDTPEAVGLAMGECTAGFARALARLQPDILVVLGDRFEMHAAAMAAVPFCIPLAHIAGGNVTVGAIDEVFRHSLTKVSHLHFPETDASAARVLQMGEEPWRVRVTGALALDTLRIQPLLSLEELGRRHGLSLKEPPLLVTFHPATRDYARTETHFGELLAALERFKYPVIFTHPNADTGGRVIFRLMEEFAKRNRLAHILPNLGTPDYFSLMNGAAAMVGNSSSGFVEAPSFRLPVVNVGDRQEGRLAAANVITVESSRDAIAAALSKALSPEFRASLQGLV